MTDSLAASALDWWIEAGVDTLADDLPRDWLAPAATPAPEPIVAPAAPAIVLPDDLVQFRRWLLEHPSVPGPPSARIDAAGDPASGTMIVVDMPLGTDRVERRLLGGEVGALFDRMLAAMRLDRAAIYLVPFSPARPASGRIAAPDQATLGELLRHHLALVRPRRLLLMGDAPARALTGAVVATARGTTHDIAHPGGTVPAVASFQPAFLRDQPDRKAAAWADLQRFMAL